MNSIKNIGLEPRVQWRQLNVKQNSVPGALDLNLT
jgi:hypothetical protein